MSVVDCAITNVIAADGNFDDKIVKAMMILAIKPKVHKLDIALLVACGRRRRQFVVDVHMMMMIAFITIKSSLVPLIEGLCAQIYFRFEISVVCSHLLLFFFVKEKIC